MRFINLSKVHILSSGQLVKSKLYQDRKEVDFDKCEVCRPSEAKTAITKVTQ